MSKGLMTADETHALLVSKAASETATAQQKASRKERRASMLTTELEPGYETKAPSGWTVGQLRAQCAVHGLSVEGTRTVLWAQYCEKFPSSSRKRSLE